MFFEDAAGRAYVGGITSWIFDQAGATFTNSSYHEIFGSTRVGKFNDWIDDSTNINWKSSVSTGSFNNSANWTIGTTVVNTVPTAYETLGFRNAGNYTVNFDAATLTNAHQLLSRAGTSTLLLNGGSVNFNSTMYEGAVVVGRYNGNNATVNFVNGTINSYDAQLGEQLGSTGRIFVGSVASAATWNVAGDVRVGGTFLGSGGTANLTVQHANSSLNILGTLKVWGKGTVNYNAGSMSVGTLDIATGGSVSLSTGGNKVLRTKAFTFAGTGKVNLTDNDMIVNDDVVSPLLTSIRPAIVSGYSNGAWTGGGIISSTAAASPAFTGRTALGYGEALTLGITNFDTIPVDTTSILIKYTYAGDADLNGMVDNNDLARLAAGWQTGTIWTSGDFNYDGKVNIYDLRLLAANWLQGISSPLAPESFAAALTSFGLPIDLASVPEPASTALAGFGLLGLLARRRRQ
jgi:hypothetical protein